MVYFVNCKVPSDSHLDIFIDMKLFSFGYDATLIGFEQMITTQFMIGIYVFVAIVSITATTIINITSKINSTKNFYIIWQ